MAMEPATGAGDRACERCACPRHLPRLQVHHAARVRSCSSPTFSRAGMPSRTPFGHVVRHVLFARASAFASTSTKRMAVVGGQARVRNRLPSLISRRAAPPSASSLPPSPLVRRVADRLQELPPRLQELLRVGRELRLAFAGPPRRSGTRTSGPPAHGRRTKRALSRVKVTAVSLRANRGCLRRRGHASLAPRAGHGVHDHDVAFVHERDAPAGTVPHTRAAGARFGSPRRTAAAAAPPAGTTQVAASSSPALPPLEEELARVARKRRSDGG